MWDGIWASLQQAIIWSRSSDYGWTISQPQFMIEILNLKLYSIFHFFFVFNYFVLRTIRNKKYPPKMKPCCHHVPEQTLLVGIHTTTILYYQMQGPKNESLYALVPGWINWLVTLFDVHIGEINAFHLIPHWCWYGMIFYSRISNNISIS